MNLWPWGKVKPFNWQCFFAILIATDALTIKFSAQIQTAKNIDYKSRLLSWIARDRILYIAKARVPGVLNLGLLRIFHQILCCKCNIYILVCYVFKQITDNFLPILLDHFFNFMYTRFFQFVFILGNYRALSAQWQSLKMCTNLTFLDIRASYLHF